jgi:hypothetical protein
MLETLTNIEDGFKPIENAFYITRKDLYKYSQDKHFSDVCMGDAILAKKHIFGANFVMFVDVDGSVKILKNRYGDTGKVINFDKKIKRNFLGRIYDSFKFWYYY